MIGPRRSDQAQSLLDILTSFRIPLTTYATLEEEVERVALKRYPLLRR